MMAYHITVDILMVIRMIIMSEEFLVIATHRLQ